MPSIMHLCIAAATILGAGPTEPEPPPTTQPSAMMTLTSEDGRPLAEMRIDPRGVSSIRLVDEPEVDWVIPRKDHAWDYREWQWWRGQPWGDMMRPRLWAQPKLHLDGLQQRYAWIQYSVDGFRGTQQIFFPEHITSDEVQWDLVTTIGNESGRDVDGYGQFFACYTRVNHRASFWLWMEGDRLITCEKLGISHLDGFVAGPRAWFRPQGRLPNWPREEGKLVGTWHHPVLVSHASEAGWRSVILIEESGCAALTQGMEGNAMDYILYPGPDHRTFGSDQAFSVHIRHHLLRSPELPTSSRLEGLWKSFSSAHEAMHEQARRLRERTRSDEAERKPS